MLHGRSAIQWAVVSIQVLSTDTQPDAGDRPVLHFAFTVDEADTERAALLLAERGVVVDGPHFHEWMPARSGYFSDVDGHSLELCALVSKR